MTPVSTPGTPDDAFEAHLRALVARTDPVPERVLEAARGSLTWRTIDEELARLVYDSALDAELAIGVRGGTARLLTFEAGPVTIELEASEERGRLEIVGQLVPAAETDVEVRHADGSVAGRSDELGRFRLAGIPAGPVSIRVRIPAAGWVATEWVTL